MHLKREREREREQTNKLNPQFSTNQLLSSLILNLSRLIEKVLSSVHWFQKLHFLQPILGLCLGFEKAHHRLNKTRGFVHGLPIANLLTLTTSNRSNGDQISSLTPLAYDPVKLTSHYKNENKKQQDLHSPNISFLCNSTPFSYT